MKVSGLFVAAAASFVVTAALASEPPAIPEFVGSIWEGQTQLAHLKMVPAPGRTAIVSAGPSHVLELTSHVSGDSVIRLLDSSGRALHTANTSAGTSAVKSFRYVVCGNRVTYSSPAPKDVPAACSPGAT
jgi:hypothetical protein